MGSGSRLLAWLTRAASSAATAGIAVLLAGLALLGAATPGSAATTGSASGRPGHSTLGIAGKFGLSPLGQATSYFQLPIAPGRAATAAIVVSNLADKTQTLVLGRALGITAANGGTAYAQTASRCSGSSCWLTGLPSRVTLPAGGRELLAFKVRVPPDTPPGQYLSGIAAESAAALHPVKVGSNGRASAQAIMVDSVTIGVAVTVGNLSTLLSRLSIHGVQGATEGSVARLNVSLYNTGQTFAGGTGQVSCQAANGRHVYRVYANILLPGDHDVVTVNAPGLPEGATVPCTILIHYGRNRLLSWSGPVVIPSAVPAGHIVHTGPGAYSELPSASGIPVWAIVLMVLGGLVLVSLWAVLLRRQRNRNLGDRPSD